MMKLELNDIVFFMKPFKFPSNNFDIMNYFTFPSGPTRSSKLSKFDNLSLIPAISILENSPVCGTFYPVSILTTPFHPSSDNFKNSFHHLTTLKILLVSIPI